MVVDIENCQAGLGRLKKIGAQNERRVTETAMATATKEMLSLMAPIAMIIG